MPQPSKKRRSLLWKSIHPNDGLSQYYGRMTSSSSSSHRSSHHTTTTSSSTIIKKSTTAWPNGAKVAINFCIHLEEGSEHNMLHGDADATTKIPQPQNQQPPQLASAHRSLAEESMYEYGTRVGFWRLHRLFATKRKMPCTLFATGMSLERNPMICKVLKEEEETNNWEIALQGYRYINYQSIERDIQNDHIHHTMSIHDRIFEKYPTGFYQPYPNMDTRSLLIEEGHIQYDSSSYGEDLPYWMTSTEDGKPLSKPYLIIPYTMTENDIYLEERCSTGYHFCEHCKKTLKELYEEAQMTSTLKLMTIGLHCRYARPGYIQGLSDFIDHIFSYYSTKTDVWLCTREQIASYWYQYHYPIGAGEPVQPWYMAQNITTHKSTLESMILTKQQQTLSPSSQKRPSTAKTSLSDMTALFNSSLHFIAPKPPEEALGESDII